MRLEVGQLELSTIVASLRKSRHYFEYVRKDKVEADKADSLQKIRLKLIKQGEKEGVFKDYLILSYTSCKTSLLRSPSSVSVLAPRSL
jgi:hypothetical protein